MPDEKGLQLPGQTKELGFGSADAFDHIQRVAQVFSKSTLVPKEYQGEANIGNVVIALEMANRMGTNPLAVMQNLYIVQGKPGWSSQFIIAAINQRGLFSPLRFRMEGTGDSRSCVAYATEKATGEILESPVVTMAMAKAEGWIDKNGSKWKTMPELMLRYRSATFFGRLYVPEVLMGIPTAEEVEDIVDITPKASKLATVQPAKSAGDARSEPEAEVQEPVHDEPEAAPEGEQRERTVQETLDLELSAFCDEQGITDADSVMKEISAYKGYSKKAADIPTLSDGRAGAALDNLRKLKKELAQG